MFCEFCPLWNGDCADVHCDYFDFDVCTDDYPPRKMKSYVDGLIKAAFTQNLPAFITPEYFQNFCGIINPPDWTVEEWLFVEKAYQFAATAHKGAKRKDTNIPYFTHPIETAYIAFQMLADPKVTAAAVLHDVVEDTSYKIGDIESEFGREVAELVSYESEDKRLDLPPEESWKIRKKEQAWYYSAITKITSELSGFGAWEEYKKICMHIFPDSIS